MLITIPHYKAKQNQYPATLSAILFLFFIPSKLTHTLSERDWNG